MKVEIKQAISLDDKTVKEVFNSRLRELVGEHYLKNGKVMKSMAYTSYHGSDPDDEEVTNPSKVLLAALQLEKALKLT